MRTALAATIALQGCMSQLDTGVMLLGSTGDAITTSTSTLATTNDATSSSSSDETTTSEDATTSTTTSSDETTAASSTGVDTEGGVDSPCGAEQKVCAVVELDGEPAGSCGEVLDLKGIVQSVAPDIWEIEDCGVCELCGGPTYTVEFVAPMEWTPSDPPVCARIAVEYAPMDALPWACSFLGVAVWADDGLSEETAPRYIGRSIETSAPASVNGLYVTPEVIDAERCAEAGCCWIEPGKYTLTFSGAGIGTPLTVAEKESVMDVQAWSRNYDVHVERSHAHKECGKIPHFDWVFKR